MPDAIRHVTLANGLQLRLRHAPRLKRAAAAIRVHAGNHDAPGKWPGLAHFLEHLFFLGTPQFPLEDGLMRYVQGVGGQVNASTRERTTDYFFETPPAALAGGLVRLCQMLAEPDLGVARQHQEREVIHAEFIAWSRNPAAQQQYALLQSVASHHPLGAFHAGNRFTLPVQNVAFQQALAGFHQRYYQGGQTVLALCGPQPLDELEQLGRQQGQRFAKGERVEQPQPAALAASTHPLVFSLNALPEGAEQALALLTACLGDSRPGTWLDALRQRGWLQGFNTQTLYGFAGQLLWHIDLKLTPAACRDEATALLHGWFGFIRGAGLDALSQGFGLLQQSRERSAGALELAQRDSTGQPFAPLDTQGKRAFEALLAALPSGKHGQWQLPPPEPLLSAGWAQRETQLLPGSLHVTEVLPSKRQYAALYLRWKVPRDLLQPLYPVLERALAPLQERCDRASVQLRLASVGDHLQLRCNGLPAAVVYATEHALTALLHPPADCWQPPITAALPLMPIRALLEQLPAAVQGAARVAATKGTRTQLHLDALWQQATWHGLAVGFEPAAHEAMAAALQQCPGQGSAPAPLAPWAARRWHPVQVPGSEHALLLFCRLPAASEATGRLLAQLLQGPVYQRLRVELQLGYAVFSAFRQVDGAYGLLFGVQSPHARPADVLGHLMEVLKGGVTLTPSSRQALAAQFDEAVMVNAEVAEWAWQTHLATQPVNLEALPKAILKVRQSDLDQLLSDLLSADCPWLCLANAAAPPAPWQWGE